MVKRIIKVFVLMLFSVSTFAQSGVEMADAFRAEGKIYVVVAVVAIILGGIVFYLFRTEQRLDKIEKLSGK